ncbi:MAG: GHMP kinase [Candidatus Aminicenantes bacterium]|nr:GHMP kinase [Candidatus Aminicenantes bacterium]
MKKTAKGTAFARAGLLGNPSDGYFGKTIAVSVKNFHAEVRLHESQELVIKDSPRDRPVYSSLSHMLEDIHSFGYYGGIRLIKAAINKFHQYCRENGIQLENINFSLNYHSDIPRQLGLGGSSAIITAALRALMDFYDVSIPQNILPSLILEAERKELGINAGFMDRVVQVYQGCVYMDLDRDILKSEGHGLYEKLDPQLLPPLYLAYKPTLAKVSGKVLSDIQAGYERGDRFVRDTLKKIAHKADEGKEAIKKKDFGQLHHLMNENFDLRSQIMTISPANWEMIKTARKCGVSAKFAGSGGAIIGMYRREPGYEQLKKEMEKLQAIVIKPLIE